MNTVRITSGIYKGRAIETPGNGTHPMGERERLALFNMIADILPGKTVLDAFSGSGALGIEALSRGAKKVYFLEKNRNACKVINRNLDKIGASESEFEVVCDDAYRYFKESGMKFSVIIADPPYDDYDEDKLAALANLADDDTMIVISHPTGKAPGILGFKLLKTKKYAGARLSVYERV